MENRTPRSKPAKLSTPATQGSDAEATPADGIKLLPDAEFCSMGSTRVVGDGVSGGLHKTSVPADTEILRKGKKTEKEVSNLGDFELLTKLGEGAMGEVWKARRTSFDGTPVENGEVVALKVLFRHVANNKKLVERLHRESVAMNQLEHPNIISAFAVGEAQGYHYVAMEFVEGDTLQKWLGRLGRFSIADALAITIDCARALEYAHQQGMVHRDIKPDNVLIHRRGIVKVADLGMVKSLDEDMALTQTGHAVGTPWYMPLEQARNAKETDGRCDIYALGCMLYCLLTGNPPFTGKTLVEVIQAKEAGTFPPARSANVDVPERLDLIVAKMTAKLPRYRYQNCGELVKDLEGLGLAGKKLSFLEGKAPKPTAKVELPSPASSADSHTDEWYVRFSKEESASAQKCTTKQVKKMLAEGTIPPTTKASRTPADGFRALATYKEFQGTAMVKQAKIVADKQTVRYRNIYKKIEEKERQRDVEEKKSDSTPSYYSTLWKPAMWGTGGIFLAVALVYALVRLLS